MGVMEITHVVERFRPIEERFGLRLEAIYADYDSESPYPLRVNYDVISDGPELKESRDIVVSAYNGKGQLIATETSYVLADEFPGIESFSELIDCAQPSKIRIYFK